MRFDRSKKAIINTENNKCLDVDQGKYNTDGMEVFWRGCHYRENQQWAMPGYMQNKPAVKKPAVKKPAVKKPAKKSVVTQIKSEHSAKMLDIAGNHFRNNQKMII